MLSPGQYMEIATVPGMGLRQVEVKPIMYMDIDTDSNNVLSNFDTKLNSHSHLLLQIPLAKEPVGRRHWYTRSFTFTNKCSISGKK